MRPKYNYGDEVRVTRNVRNDGTYPGLDIGAPLIRRGSTGFVQNVGTYLQDQIIYSVHFLQEDLLVGCREEELVAIGDPWVDSKFEFRDKVQAVLRLASNGAVLVEQGTQGEVLKVVRELDAPVQYHVRFPGRTLQVPETALEFSEVTLKQAQA